MNEIFADYFTSEFEDPMNAYTSSMANYGGGAAAVAIAQNPGGAVPPQEHLPTGGIRTAFHTTAAAAAAPANQGVQHYQQHATPLAKRQKIESQPAMPRPGGLTSRLGVPMPLIQGQNGVQAGTSQLSANPSMNGVSLPVGVGIRLGGAGSVDPTTARNAATRVGGPGFNMWGGAQATGMSDQAIAERRQRNREHAKRSRVRKKFMLESLQEQVASLQLENQKLRILVQDNIPEYAQKIISECCTTSTLFGDGTSETDGPSKRKGSTSLVGADFQLMESLSSGQQNFVLSDPRLPDNPIVFATPGFYKLTGYTQEQVLGRNCRFLQGPGTDPKTVEIIRKAIATGSDCTVCILNYKADGTPFWNQFFVAALRDSDNCIVNYVSDSFGCFCVGLSKTDFFSFLQVGVQTEIEPDAGANALEDRVNAVLPLQNKDEDEKEES